MSFILSVLLKPLFLIAYELFQALVVSLTRWFAPRWLRRILLYDTDRLPRLFWLALLVTYILFMLRLFDNFAVATASHF